MAQRLGTEVLDISIAGHYNLSESLAKLISGQGVAGAVGSDAEVHRFEHGSESSN